MRRLFIALAATAALLFAGTSPAAAQPRQEGLVNLYVSDVTAQVPISVAANVCDVAVNVLAQSADFGATECEAIAQAQAENGGHSNRPPRQRGLVNIALHDVTVQVPVAVAANICDVAVNVLARTADFANTNCQVLAESGATN